MGHRVITLLREKYFHFFKSGVPNAGHYTMAELWTATLTIYFTVHDKIM